MSPIKLVVIAILLYIGYRLLIGDWSKRKGKKESKPSSVGEDSVADVLVEDPVCHTLVPKQQAVRLKHNENIVYFCSEKCCDLFVSQQGEKE